VSPVSEPASTSSTFDDSIDAMIREFFKAWERRDVDHIVSCFTDNAVYHNVPLEPIVGKVAIREFVSRHADRPPRHFEIHHQVVSGGVVMNERTDYATIGGREVVLPICGIFDIEDGRIKAWREYFDTGAFRST
jgi:limonene-1,2-epoxide hydrolase